MDLGLLRSAAVLGRRNELTTGRLLSAKRPLQHTFLRPVDDRQQTGALRRYLVPGVPLPAANQNLTLGEFSKA